MKAKIELLSHIKNLREDECKVLLDFLNNPEQAKKMVEAYNREQTEMPSEKEIRKGRSKILALLKDKVPNTLRAEIDDIIKDSFRQSTK